MKAKIMRWCDVTFLKGAVNPQGFPEPYLPEVAFVGRSNVGKSSLLNALWGRKKMAHTSKTPGKTAEINFFNVDEKLMCVDLPGYGYAKRSGTMQKMWHRLMPAYLEGRSALVHVFLLVDVRHDPKKSDIETMNWLYRLNLPLTLILTKIDKVSKAQAAKMQSVWQKLASSNASHILPFSIKNTLSAEALQTFIEKEIIAQPHKVHR